MAWREVSAMDRRKAFVRLALLEGRSRHELCRRFGIGAETGYKWLGRFAAGEREFKDRSRRPLSSPLRSSPAVQAPVLAVRIEHPAWLEARGDDLPAYSTVHAILARHGRIIPPPGGGGATLRFAAEAPNAPWQMDVTGWPKPGDGRLPHPLAIADDHSRFSPCLEACAGRTGAAAMDKLTQVLRIHGLPAVVFTGNGKPWGRQPGHALDQVRRVARQARRPAHPFQALSPAEPGQERALPPKPR